MKRIISNSHFLFFSILFINGIGAQNLAPNNSFEDYSTCPTGISQMAVVDDWNQPGPGTSDYLNACYLGPPGPGVPLNVWGYQEALTGDGYCGFYCHLPQPTGREYIQALLTEPLEAGECYELEMYISAADEDWIGVGISNIGIYLSETPPLVSNTDGNIYASPQVFFQYAVVNQDEWIQLIGIYEAVGGEEYITIGNFSTQGTYAVETINPNAFEIAYYYVEDVRVELYAGSGEQEIEETICVGECFEYDDVQYCSPGTYVIVPESSCYSSATLTIIQEDFAIADIEEPMVLDCNTLTVTLDASGSTSGPDVSYEWSGPNNFTSDIQNPDITDPGIYTLIVDSPNLCPGETSIEVFQDLVEPNLSAEIIGEINCNNSSVTLSGSSSTSNVTYHWSGPGVQTDLPTTNTTFPGIYTFTVTGENGCTSSLDVNVIADYETPDISAEVDGMLDCINLDVLLSGSSNSPNATYQWTGPGVDTDLPFVSTNVPGIYTFTVTGENGCTGSQIVNVLQDIEFPDIFAEANGSINCNNSSVLLSGSSGTPNVTYHWSGPGLDTGSPVTTTDQPGLFTFTVTGSNGCISTSLVLVTEEDSDLDFNASVNDTLDCENTTVTLTGISNEPNATYQWTGPGVSEEELVIEVSQAGEYTFSILTESGCSGDTTIIVEQNGELPEIIISSIDTLNCITSTVSIDANSSNGIGTLSFEWQDLDGNILGDESVLEVDSSGSYILIIVDNDNGCSSTSTIEIVQDSISPIAITNDNLEISCNETIVTLDGNASIGIGELNFIWLNEAGDTLGSNALLDVSDPEVYTLVITDTGNGCTGTTSIEVMDNTNPPIVDPGPNQILTCIENTATLDGSNSSSTGELTYQWTDPGNDIVGDSAIIEVENEGIYTLLITGENGCSASAEVEIILNDEQPIADAGEAGTLNCSLQIITLGSEQSSSGDSIIYEWFNTNNELLSEELFFDINSPDTFLLVVTNIDNGCTASNNVIIDQDIEIPTADAGPDGILTCDVSETTLDGSNSSGNDISFQWLNETMQIISEEAIVEVSQTGVYTLIVTNTVNGCTASSTVEVTPDANLPTSIIDLNDELTCQTIEVLLDGSTSSSISGNLSFQWLDDLGDPVSQADQISVSDPGIYTLIITDTENGCTHSTQVEVIQDIENPLADAGPNANLTCEDSEATLDGSGSSGSNLSFEWLDENDEFVSDEIMISVTEAGTYTLIVTNGNNGCTASSTVEVIPDANVPTALIELPEELNCTITEVTLDGSNSTSVSGNTSYEWQDELGNELSISNQVDVTSPGIYILIVTDTENGCTHSTQIEVLQDVESPIADAGPDGSLNCTDVEATLDGSNSTGSNLSYEWLDENDEFVSDQAMVTVGQLGTYTLIVTNGNNGCTASSTVLVIPDTDAPTALIETPSVLTCETIEVSLDGSNSISISGNISYEWQDELGNELGLTNQVDVMSPGVYILIVTDTENGCTHSTQIEVIQDIEAPIADAGPEGTLNCVDLEATLDGSNSTGSNLSYEWLDENDQFISDQVSTIVTSSGTYTLIITNGTNGCTASSEVMVSSDTNLPTSLIDVPEELTCTTTEVTLDGINSTSVSGNQSYEWQDEFGNELSQNAQVNISSPGIYNLIVTDTENGCTHSSQIEVTQDIEPPVADAGVDANLTCTDSEATLDASNSSGNNLSYQWLDENNLLIAEVQSTQVTEAGQYTLIVSNGTNGCTASSTVNVIPDANAPNALIENPTVLTCDDTEVTLDGSGSTSVSGNITYEWQDDLGNELSLTDQINVSNPGTYILIVTDIDNGCTHSTQIEVTQDIVSPIADAVSNGILTCTNLSTMLDGSNSIGDNLTYEWLDENNQFVSDQMGTEVTISGTYTLVITDGTNGCMASTEIIVTSDTNPPTALIEQPAILNCQDTEVILDGSNSSSTSGNTSYSWQDEMGNEFSTSNQVNVSSSGNYTLIVTDEDNGCVHATEVEVLEDVEAPTVMIDNTGPLNFDCNTSTLVLDASGSSPFGNLSFSWTTVDGNILSDADTPGPEIGESGVYVLTITNLTNFCTAIDSVTIGENYESPTALIDNPDLLTCVTTELSLDATGSSTAGDFTYNWTSNPSGGIVSGGNSLEPIINQAGTYTLTVLNNENGCTSQSSITVNEDIEAPTAIAGVPEEFDCLTEEVTLDGTGSSQGNSFIYEWTGGGTIDNGFSLFPTVYEAGVYQLLVSNQENGCTASTQINVTENTNEPVGFDYELIEPDCFGSLGSIEIYSIEGGQTPYLYSIDGGENFSQQSIFSFLEAGNYSVLVQDANGCEYEDLINVPAAIEINVNLEAEVLLNLGDDYDLNAQINFPINEIDTIIWSPAQGLSCTDCLNPQITSITEQGLYTITVINLDGCQTTAEIQLRVQKSREIFIPNVFTPHNEDGFNDIFMIHGNDDKIKEVKTFQIYDRWGEVVFEATNFQANDPSNGWDGFFKNERLNSGVFVYLAEIEFIDGITEIYSGDVTLIE